MAANDRGIGSEGLEQGGPNLGNDYSRPLDTGGTGARDAIIVPRDKTPDETNDTLNMDTESSRDLTSEVPDYEDDFDETDDTEDEMMEDDVLQGLDDEDDETDEEENDII
jgi:hypothetical protein